MTLRQIENAIIGSNFNDTEVVDSIESGGLVKKGNTVYYQCTLITQDYQTEECFSYDCLYEVMVTTNRVFCGLLQVTNKTKIDV